MDARGLQQINLKQALCSMHGTHVSLMTLRTVAGSSYGRGCQQRCWGEHCLQAPSSPRTPLKHHFRARERNPGRAQLSVALPNGVARGHSWLGTLTAINQPTNLSRPRPIPTQPPPTYYPSCNTCPTENMIMSYSTIPTSKVVDEENLKRKFEEN